MAPARKKPTPMKRGKKKVMAISTKIQLLDFLKEGYKVSTIAEKFGVNESTIRSIRDNESKIRQTALQMGFNSEVCKVTRRRDMEKMEEMLNMWIQDLIQKKVPLRGSIVREQALFFFKEVQGMNQSHSHGKFAASRGWFEKFKKRFSLDHLNFTGEVSRIDDTTSNNHISPIPAVTIIKQEDFEDVEDVEEMKQLELVHDAEEELEGLLSNPENHVIDNEQFTFPDKSIIKIMRKIREAVDEALEHDPINTRSFKFKHHCDIALSCYQELYKDILERTKQSLSSKLLSPNNQ